MELKLPCNGNCCGSNCFIYGLNLVICYLAVPDVGSLAVTCKQLNHDCRRPHVWRSLFHSCFKHASFCFAQDAALSYLDKCKRAHAALNFRNPRWYQLNSAFPEDGLEYLSRQAHGSCIVKKLPKYGWGFVMFGGFTISAHISNDICLFTEKTKDSGEKREFEWQNYNLKGKMDINTYGHTLTAVPSVSRPKSFCSDF